MYTGHAAPLIKHYLPDGLWAFAAVSAILIIWNRQINWWWVLAMGFLFVGFEYLQHIQWIKGTGDILDILVYFIFGYIAILVNPYFKYSFNHYEKKV